MYSIVCIQKNEKVVFRRKSVAHIKGTRITVFYPWERRKCKRRKSAGHAGSRDEGTCLVALSLGIRSYVESAGASTRRQVSPQYTRRLITSSREVLRVRSCTIQSNRSESARFHLLMRTYAASCSRKTREDNRGGIVPKMRGKIVLPDKARQYANFFKLERCLGVPWSDEYFKK